MAGIDDSIVETLTEGSTYEKLRLRRGMMFDHPLPDKIQYSAVLLASLAFVYPALYLLPPGVRTRWLGPPATATPTLANVAAIAGVVVFLNAGGLAWIAFRVGSASSLTKLEARRLLRFEQLLSWFGFVSGGAAVLGTMGLLALGFGGVETVASVTTTGVANPFVPDNAPRMSFVSVACGIAAGILLVVSTMAKSELS